VSLDISPIYTGCGETRDDVQQFLNVLKEMSFYWV